MDLREARMRELRANQGGNTVIQSSLAYFVRQGFFVAVPGAEKEG